MERAADRNPLDISLLETVWPRGVLCQCQQGSPTAGCEGTGDPYISLQDFTLLYFYIPTSWLSVLPQVVLEPAERNAVVKRIASQIRSGIAGQWTQPVWLGEMRYVVPTCTGLPLEYGLYTTALARAAVSGELGSTRCVSSEPDVRGTGKKGWRKKWKQRMLEKELIFVVKGGGEGVEKKSDTADFCLILQWTEDRGGEMRIWETKE